MHVREKLVFCAKEYQVDRNSLVQVLEYDKWSHFRVSNNLTGGQCIEFR